MFADEIRRAVEAAPRLKLPDVAALMWRAYGDGQVSEAEAEEISARIEARKLVPAPAPAPRAAVGSRPRTDTSLERRRRWAASGRLPPQLAARFTPAELAALSALAAEVARVGACRLAVGHLAAIAGVSETSVRNAIREARRLGLVAVEERRLSAWRSDTNVVRIVSAEWTAWLRLARRTPDLGWGLSRRDERKGGGCRFAHPTPTISSNPVNSAPRNRRRAAGGQGRGGDGARSGHG